MKKKIKYLLLGAILLLAVSLDRQFYPRVEYRYMDDTIQVTCKDESSMLTHMSSFLIGTTSRDKEAYETYCVGEE
jgi:hypothetical protein